MYVYDVSPQSEGRGAAAPGAPAPPTSGTLGHQIVFLMIHFCFISYFQVSLWKSKFLTLELVNSAEFATHMVQVSYDKCAWKGV